MSSQTLPYFNVEGLLSRGDYALTIEQLRQSHLVTGKGNPSTTWDTVWRMHLVDNLELLVLQLWNIGIDRIFVDGSFVENKDYPSDIDGYFECDRRAFASGRIQSDLNAQDPFQAWDWSWNSRRRTPEKVSPQLPMWFHYHVELYPHYGQHSGIRDRHGNLLEFPAAFRKTKDSDQPKGIIQIIRL